MYIFKKMLLNLSRHKGELHAVLISGVIRFSHINNIGMWEYTIYDADTTAVIYRTSGSRLWYCEKRDAQCIEP